MRTHSLILLPFVLCTACSSVTKVSGPGEGANRNPASTETCDLLRNQLSAEQGLPFFYKGLYIMKIQRAATHGCEYTRLHFGSKTPAQPAVGTVFTSVVLPATLTAGLRPGDVIDLLINRDEGVELTLRDH